MHWKNLKEVVQLSPKRSFVSDQVESNVKWARFDKNSILLSETTVSTKPTFSDLDPHFDTLEKLERCGAIQVTYPKQSLGILVKILASAITMTKIKTLLFLMSLPILLNNFHTKI